MSHSELYGGFKVHSTDRLTDALPILESIGFDAFDGLTAAANKVLDRFDEMEYDPIAGYNRIDDILNLISEVESIALALAAKTHGGSAVLVSVFDDCNEKSEDRPQKLAEALRYVADQVEVGKTSGT